MQDLKGHVRDSVFCVIVKTNAGKTEFLGFDEARGALRLAIAAPPVDGKANDELLKFLKKELGSCEIISGKTSRRKRIRLK